MSSSTLSQLVQGDAALMGGEGGDAALLGVEGGFYWGKFFNGRMDSVFVFILAEVGSHDSIASSS
jgi:hypothetical protein